MDLYVQATKFLDYSHFNRSDEDFLSGDITNENELLHNFGYYFSKGAASEYVFLFFICF